MKKYNNFYEGYIINFFGEFSKFKKEIVDKKYEPQGQNARGIYNILEKVRCDAIGANAMSGVSKNLHQIL